MFKHLLAKLLNIVSLPVLLVALAAAGILVWNWYHPKIEVQKEYVNVPQIKEVVKIQRVNVPGPKEIVTIEKEKVIKELKLPEWLGKDAKQQVIATGEIAPHKGKTDVVATLNTETGEAALISKQRPIPFMSFGNDKEIGIRYGIGTKTGAAGALYGRWTFFRVGAIHTAVYGEIDNSATGKAMVDIGYRW